MQLPDDGTDSQLLQLMARLVLSRSELVPPKSSMFLQLKPSSKRKAKTCAYLLKASFSRALRPKM